MACILMANILMAYILIAYIAMAYIVMVDIVIAPDIRWIQVPINNKNKKSEHAAHMGMWHGVFAASRQALRSGAITTEPTA